MKKLNKVIFGMSGGLLLIILCEKIRRKEMKRKLYGSIDGSKNSIESDKGVPGFDLYDVEKLEEKMNKPYTDDCENGNDIDEREFVSRMQALSPRELELLVDIIPVELCMARIQKELDKAKRVENYIKDTLTMLK